MHRVSGAFVPRAGTIVVEVTATAGLIWSVEVRDVDGESLLRLDGVPMLVGMAPFTGISVGFDGEGPVDWDLHREHGTFPLVGGLHRVRYVPGAPAPENREIVMVVDEVTARLMD